MYSNAMSPSYYEVELDELCHDLSLQPNERFDVEAEDGVITFKRIEAGYDIDQ